jgi:hypothetical protein
MDAVEREVEEEPGRSRAAGACVLVVLAVVVVAVVFALSPAAGVLAVWVIGTLALWRAARRMSDSSATPPPRVVAASGDVYAGETNKIARVVPIAGGVGCILHPVREQTPETPGND